MTVKIDLAGLPRVPASQWRASVKLLVESANACGRNPAQAENLAVMAAEKVQEFVSEEHVEHLPAVARDPKRTQLARLRLKSDRRVLKTMRDALASRVGQPGYQTLLHAVDILVRDLDRAYKLAPLLDDEKEDDVPALEFAGSDTPQAVDYGALLDASPKK